MRIIISTLIIAMGITAGFSEERVDERQENQKNRIVDGAKSGSLTRGETKRLVKEQHRINHLEHRLEADGELSTKDKVRLERRQDRASRHIARQKHDGRQRNRIRQGIKSGEITRAEANHLVNGQKKIRRAERRARVDGKFTDAERKRIGRKKAIESRKIHRAKHNKKNRR